MNERKKQILKKNYEQQSVKNINISKVIILEYITYFDIKKSGELF